MNNGKFFCRPAFRAKGLTRFLLRDIIPLADAGYNQNQIGCRLGISDDSWRRWRKKSEVAESMGKWTIYRRLFKDLARIRDSQKFRDLDAFIRSPRKFYKIVETIFFGTRGEVVRITRKMTEVPVRLKVILRLLGGRTSVLGGAKEDRLRVQDLIPNSPQLSDQEWCHKYGRGSQKDLAPVRPALHAHGEQRAHDFPVKKIAKSLRCQEGMDRELRDALVSLAHDPLYESSISRYFNRNGDLFKTERHVREIMPNQAALDYLIQNGVKTPDPGELPLPKDADSWEDCADSFETGPLSSCYNKLLRNSRMEPEKCDSSGREGVQSRRRSRIVKGHARTFFVQIKKNCPAEKEWKARAAALRMADSKRTEGQNGVRPKMRSREDRTTLEKAVQRWAHAKVTRYEPGKKAAIGEKLQTFYPAASVSVVKASWRNVEEMKKRKRKREEERKTRISPIDPGDEYVLKGYIPPSSIIRADRG